MAITPKPQNAVDRRFDLLEKKAEQQARAQTQQSEQALKRRFASIGSLGSGASIKAGQQVRQQGGEALARAREGIEAQKTAEDIRRQDVLEGRQFATSERESQQQFAGDQAKLGREFARGERTASQEFGRGERLGSQEFAGGQAQLGRDLAASQFGQEFDLKMQEFGLNTQVTKANLATAFAELQGLIKGEGLAGVASQLFSPEIFEAFGVKSGGEAAGNNVFTPQELAQTETRRAEIQNLVNSGSISKTMGANFLADFDEQIRQEAVRRSS